MILSFIKNKLFNKNKKISDKAIISEFYPVSTKLNNKKCLVIPLLTEDDEDSLTDNEVILVLINWKSFKPFWARYRWNANCKCLYSSNGDLYKINDVRCIRESDFEINHTILNYDPTKINPLHLKHLYDICYKGITDQTENDDIWERLVEFFETEGIDLDDNY